MKRSRRGAAEVALIVISVAFVAIMLVMPLASIVINALKKGWSFYREAVLTEYVLSAFRVTMIATVVAVLVNTGFGVVSAWLLTMFSFKGKKILSAAIDIPFSISPVIAGLAFIMTFGRLGWANGLLQLFSEWTGTEIRIVFALPGVILATIFVTFPFISREIIPVLNTVGKDEEEAAALMGAGGFMIFRRITFPKMRWAMLYGMILCAARAMGEFGAVNALSKTRGKTFTLPLEIDALYLSGSADAIVSAFAVSSILVILAVLLLLVRNYLILREERRKRLNERYGTGGSGALGQGGDEDCMLN